jgi:membrane protein DedA with SNARE-associated domain
MHVDFAYFRDLGIAFAMFVSAGLGFPFPEEVLIVGAGIWAASHSHYGALVWLMLPVCIIGVIIADVLLYGTGRFFGTRLLKRPWVQKIVPPEKMLRIEQNYQAYGVTILLFGRLVPGIRVPLFLTAGIMRLSVPRFLLADGLGAVLGNGLLFFLGYWFGESFQALIEKAEKEVSRSGPIIVIIVVGGVLAYLLYRFLRRPVPEGDIKKEVPIIGPTIAEHIQRDETVIRRSATDTVVRRTVQSMAKPPTDDALVKPQPADPTATSGAPSVNGEVEKKEEKRAESDSGGQG